MVLARIVAQHEKPSKKKRNPPTMTIKVKKSKITTKKRKQKAEQQRNYIVSQLGSNQIKLRAVVDCTRDGRLHTDPPRLIARGISDSARAIVKRGLARIAVERETKEEEKKKRSKVKGNSKKGGRQEVEEEEEEEEEGDWLEGGEEMEEEEMEGSGRSGPTQQQVEAYRGNLLAMSKGASGKAEEPLIQVIQSKDGNLVGDEDMKPVLLKANDEVTRCDELALSTVDTFCTKCTNNEPIDPKKTKTCDGCATVWCKKCIAAATKRCREKSIKTAGWNRCTRCTKAGISMCGDCQRDMLQCDVCGWVTGEQYCNSCAEAELVICSKCYQGRHADCSSQEPQGCCDGEDDCDY
jgi:hypothetical protein